MLRFRIKSLSSRCAPSPKKINPKMLTIKQQACVSSDVVVDLDVQDCAMSTDIHNHAFMTTTSYLDADGGGAGYAL